MNTDQTIRFNDILVSLLQLKVWLGEVEIHFTLSELRILLIFLAEPYRTISTEELVRRADLTSSDSLHQLICRVRSLLSQQYIFTASAKAGYAFAQRGRLRATETEETNALADHS